MFMISGPLPWPVWRRDGGPDIAWLERSTISFSDCRRCAAWEVTSGFWHGCDYNRSMKVFVCAMVALLPALAAAPEADKGKSFGGAGAPVTIELFTCFTCPHCKLFHDEIVPQLMRDYVVSGKVYLVNRD